MKEYRLLLLNVLFPMRYHVIAIAEAFLAQITNEGSITVLK
jgi:hypothetical protein